MVSILSYVFHKHRLIFSSLSCIFHIALYFLCLIMFYFRIAFIFKSLTHSYHKLHILSLEMKWLHILYRIPSSFSNTYTCQFSHINFSHGNNIMHQNFAWLHVGEIQQNCSSKLYVQ